MLAGYIKLNPGPVASIDNNNMWDDLPFRKCYRSTTSGVLLFGLKIKLVLTVVTQIAVTSGVCLKIGESILFI